MDWGRAKLIFIIAFFCLDLFLGWQVKQLLPTTQKPSLPTPSPSGFGTTTTITLPPLIVRTQNPTAAATLTRLRVDPATCAAKELLISCSGLRGAVFQDWNGLLEYNEPKRLVGIRLLAKSIAEAALQKIEDPGQTLPLSFGEWHPMERTMIFNATEKDAGGDILFNGDIQITVSPKGTNIKRWWLQVQPGRQPAQPTISEQQAVAIAVQIIGPAATPSPVAPPLEGYYFPTAEQPGVDWSVYPVWQIRNSHGQCYYINAYNGEIESKGTGAVALDPQGCYALSSTD